MSWDEKVTEGMCIFKRVRNILQPREGLEYHKLILTFMQIFSTLITGKQQL